MPYPIMRDATARACGSFSPEAHAGVKQCDLCGATRFDRIADRDRRGKPWQTVACTACGLVCHERIPSEAELAEYYSRSYRQDYKGESAPSERRVLRAWRKGERVFRALAGRLSPGARVFEVGAGTGCNLKPFQAAGFSVSGIEPHGGFQEYAKHTLHLAVEQQSLFDLEPKPRCDVVLLIHVIEHFRSPREALAQIWHLLPPGGLLYLECPSLAVPYTDAADHFHFAHIHTFTPGTLIGLARSCGFEVAETHANGDGCNHKLIFRRAEPAVLHFDGSGYERTLEILRQYHTPWRRWGFSYWRARGRRIHQYAREFFYSRSQVRRLLHGCRPVTTPHSVKGC
jgi:SAM-dependent methyltransferase